MGNYKHIVFLTGAGLSAASGLPTYRGPGGLWQQEETVSLASHKALQQDPDKVWQLFASMREKASAAQPNAAHKAVAQLQHNHSQAVVQVLTQNVDGLHQRAGSTDVVELHGSLFRSRCSNPDCDLAPFDDQQSPQSAPHCQRCDAHLRVDVVLFEEPMPVAAERRAKLALRDCDLFIAVGTSGTVTPAANFVRSADYAGARTVLVNLEPMHPANPYFHEEILGPAESVLPGVLGHLCQLNTV